MHFDLVIVGGGAGGVELAARLGRSLGAGEGPRRIALVDFSVYHIWKPTLHEIAAGTLNVHQEGLSYAMLARRNHFTFVRGEMKTFDPKARMLTLAEITAPAGQSIAPERSISYTRCVLAIGSGSNLFNTLGAEQAYVLEKTEDAERFHHVLLAAFTKASFSEEKSLDIAIVGAGATGVELSAELLEAHSEFEQGMIAEQRFRLGVTIVEAAPRILGALPAKISRQGTVALERKGIRILTEAKVQSVDSTGLQTSLGHVAADIVVWAAGVQASPANAHLGLAITKSNQIVVDDRLCTSDPDVYAMGDCAACPWEGDRLVPPRAQAAHQQASYLARMIIALMRERKPSGPFKYRDFGSLVSLGERHGVGSLMGGLGGRNFLVEGFVARCMYAALHLNHHRSILGIRRTIILALARLLQRRVSGRLKLH